MLSLIVAVTEQGVIGKDGTLIWRIPSDLKYFKEKTMGKRMIMGRKTFESLPGMLPGRKHVVLTKNKDYEVPQGVELIHDFKEVEKYQLSDEEVFIIGGGEIFRHFLPACQRLYITWVGRDFQGDTYFPVEELESFQEVQRTEALDEYSGIPLTFTVYVKRGREEGEERKGSAE